MPAFVLTEWGRVAVVASGIGVVVIAAIVVVCLVGPGCWLNYFLLSDEERRRQRKIRGSIYNQEAPSLRLTSYEKQALAEDTLTPLHGVHNSNGKVGSPPRYSGGSLGPLNLGGGGGGGGGDTALLHGGAPPGSQPPTETNALLGPLSSKRDSTYSSMSENSGRTSPTNSCRSSVGDSVGSAAGSPVGGEAAGQVSFGLQFVPTGEDRQTGKLIITVLEAHGLTGREYLGGACDPYFKVVIWKERRSIRKVKSPPIHIFRTRTIRHTTEPTFNQSFVCEVTKSDLKELVVKLVAMDTDKWTSATTIGEVTQPIRDIKNMATIDHRTTLNYFLEQPKLELGEVLFGLSYLPTAQRLSVSVIKASNLKYTNVTDDIAEFSPYIRVLLISGSGRVLKKKKTTWRAETNSPEYNETLIFDLPQTQVEHVTFILAMCTRQPSSVSPQSSAASVHLYQQDSLPDPSLDSQHSEHQSSKKNDKYIGKVVLGCAVRGEEERKHWQAVLSSPRKVISQWHHLK